ncbi:hypothetical protein [Kribbella sindirgiensis]|uniref:Uncharacterized protein n=1 Tax=Kribbella sindirgiensis TaxID=1124744 RepID=A0A4R0HXN7_9ACTN|nr:hypothetical protein [Kribbella sindirgiensis]TCC15471.1 hypothetical protein E0H50_41760 [Kribbella sindirgiensis]
MTDSAYEIEVSYHQFYLVVQDASPVLDPATVGPVLALDPQVPSAVIVRTGCADGPVNVTVRIGVEPLPDLATAGDRWEVGEQLVIPVEGDLYLVPPMGGPAYVVYTPPTPGLHLVRVLARGRTTHYDAVVWESSEDYDITITPVGSDPGRRTTGDDGLYRD